MNEHTELDSDAREDRRQEALLDRSFDDWLTQNIDKQTRLQQDITDVPNGNVWEAADHIDGGT